MHQVLPYMHHIIHRSASILVIDTISSFYFIGNVYFVDSYNYVVRKITVSTGIITTIAGTGIDSYSGDGGAATSAALSYVRGLTLDSSGSNRHVSYHIF